MADDRLDDAIDAVVRAVDRIERATRAPGSDPGPRVAFPASQAGPGSTPAPLGDATRPIPGSVGATGSFWAPRADPAGQGGEAGPAQPTGSFTPPGQQTGAFASAAQPAGGFPPPGQQTGAFPANPETTAEFSALGAATVRSHADGGASPEVHELLGRIVGRMQSLDDHLASAARLRGEISELVARLAAAAAGR